MFAYMGAVSFSLFCEVTRNPADVSVYSLHSVLCHLQGTLKYCLQSPIKIKMLYTFLSLETEILFLNLTEIA
jgi:hypothetical protein